MKFTLFIYCSICEHVVLTDFCCHYTTIKTTINQILSKIRGLSLMNVTISETNKTTHILSYLTSNIIFIKGQCSRNLPVFGDREYTVGS